MHVDNSVVICLSNSAIRFTMIAAGKSYYCYFFIILFSQLLSASEIKCVK